MPALVCALDGFPQEGGSRALKARTWATSCFANSLENVLVRRPYSAALEGSHGEYYGKAPLVSDGVPDG